MTRDKQNEKKHRSKTCASGGITDPYNTKNWD